MERNLILNLETSSTVCSVSLSENGNNIFLKEENNGFTHAENLHLFIESALKESKVPAKGLSAIAVGMGPGSYTGLRIGMSTAKGLCYALEKPLIGISTLQSMAWKVKQLYKEFDGFFCPLIDARRMEVYTALYDSKLDEAENPCAKILDENNSELWTTMQKTIFFGSGMEKSRPVLEKNPDFSFCENILPSALWMEELSFKKFLNKDFENLAYSEPFYGKEFHDNTKK